MKKLLCLCVASACLCGCASVTSQYVFKTDAFQPDGEDDFLFIVMGDNRPWESAQDPVVQNEHFLGIINRANQYDADFAVNVGDLILGYTRNKELILQEWDAYHEACKRFRMPLVSIPGNHDVWDKQSQRIWQKRFGPLYFSWNHKNCHFIALSSDTVGQKDTITGKQLKWLKKDLEKARSARRIFVFLHKPLWDSEQKGDNNQWLRDVHPLLAQYGVDTVFAGHRHEYSLHPTKDNVRYVITGGAGAPLRSYEITGSFFHLLTVDVKGTAGSLKVVTMHEELPPDCVTPQKNEALLNALTVEPLSSLPPDNSTVIRLRLQNPVERELKAVVTMAANNPTWQTITNQFVIPGGEEHVLALELEVGSRLLPLPHTLLELVDGEKKLFEWSGLLSKAFVDIIPFVKEWKVAGPFDLGLVDSTDEERSDTERYRSMPMVGWDSLLPPEKDMNLGAAYEGKGDKKVEWQSIKAGANGFVNLDAFYEDNDYAVACAVAYIHSPEGGKYQVSTGSDDSILVRINGDEVWRHHAPRAAAPDQDVFEIELVKGWNQVFLKIAERWGGWGFYFRIIDPENTLKFSAAIPSS